MVTFLAVTDFRSSARRVTLTNQVLRALSEDARRRLHSHLEPTRLAVGKVLYEPGDTMRHAFFPERAVISLLALTGDDTAAEIAMIGR
jgi:hypothetical protein